MTFKTIKMKTRHTFYSLLFAILAVGVFAACSGNKSEGSAHDHAAHDEHHANTAEVEDAGKPQFEVAGEFQTQLASVFRAYTDLQEAFVSSDASSVKREAAKTAEALGAADMTLLTGAAHNDWMHYGTAMADALSSIQETEDIEVQRESFSVLSDNLYKSAKAFGLGGEKAYYAYCPMAFDDQGGYWLTDEEQIRNPYFGDKMLACGTIRENL